MSTQNQTEPAPSSQACGPHRILVVDDEFSILSFLGKYLSSKGYQVMLATDGKEALDIFRRRSVDLVLSDVKMPGMNGVRLLKAVKEINPIVPVILISGFHEIATVVEALKAGAENFLTKPLDMHRLLTVLDRSLNLSCIRMAASEHIPGLEQTTTLEVPSNSEWICKVVNQISLSAVGVGFASHDLANNVKLALIEAVTNAMEHGNDWDPNKSIQLELTVNSERLKAVICDQGPGFDFSELPDPTDDTNLLSERGRGIFLMQAIMDDVIYQEPGNCLTLIKRKPSVPEVA